MPIITERLAQLESLPLLKGGHEWRDAAPELCLFEAVAYIAGEQHSDHPECASRVLGSFGRELNDQLPDDLRQQLKPLVPKIVGTAGDGLDEARSYMALDWLIRTYTPAWLDLAGLSTEAQELRDLRRIVDLAAAVDAGPVALRAREKSAAAWDAAGAAAGDAAGAAARAAAWDAARAAAWDAARAAARAAAWAAAGAAAGAAAREKLAPTVTELQQSAIALFTSMIRPEQVTA
jgi:hypothetical protein